MTKAIITGAGQDATHLALFLLQKDYEVIIATRRSGSSGNWRFKEEGLYDYSNFKIEYCDLTEFHVVCELVKKHKPDELYNLAAQSFVQSSFNHVHTTFNSNTIGHINILEAVRYHSPLTKIYFASSSEMFGKVQETPQSETTPFYPRSPYGVSKLASYWMGKNYRESFGMFVANGILFNHEGRLRGEEFVTRKISLAVAKMRIAYDNDLLPNVLEIGNMYSKRDWGNAEDYVKGMWLMLQQDIPEDFILATNKTYTIKDFINEAWGCISETPLDWQGKDVDEQAIDFDGNIVVRVNPEFFRPAEVQLLLGDYSKAKKILNWEPETNFGELVKLMVNEDTKRVESL